MGVNWLNNHRPHPPPLHHKLLARPHQSHHCQRMISPVLSSQTNYYNIVLVYAAALGCGCGGSVFVFYWFSVNKICISLVRPVASVAHRVPGAVVSYNTNNNRDTVRCHTGTLAQHHPYQLYLQRIDFMVKKCETQCRHVIALAPPWPGMSSLWAADKYPVSALSTGRLFTPGMCLN